MKSVNRAVANFVTVGTTAVKVPFSQAPRELCALRNMGAQTVYLGFDSTVTTTTGFPILTTEVFSLDGSSVIYLISGTAGQDVRWIEAG